MCIENKAKVYYNFSFSLSLQIILLLAQKPSENHKRNGRYRIRFNRTLVPESRGAFCTHSNILFIPLRFSRLREPRRSALLANTAPDMARRCVRWSRRWKSLSTPSTDALSAERFVLLLYSSVSICEIICPF